MLPPAAQQTFHAVDLPNFAPYVFCVRPAL